MTTATLQIEETLVRDLAVTRAVVGLDGAQAFMTYDPTGSLSMTSVRW